MNSWPGRALVRSATALAGAGPLRLMRPGRQVRPACCTKVHVKVVVFDSSAPDCDKSVVVM